MPRINKMYNKTHFGLTPISILTSTSTLALLAIPYLAQIIEATILTLTKFDRDVYRFLFKQR